jgi:hypothetical protein
MSSRWILLTAGFGSEDMQGAALRVRAQAQSLKLFSNVIAFTNHDLSKCCPRMVSRYGDYLNSSHKGFGYFAWKVELVQSAFSGAFGPCDGVVWVDAGCEVYKSVWTRLRLKSWMKSAEKTGTFVYSLDTPEQDFTKRALFALFPNLDSADRSPQFQATWFMLHGEVGKSIADEWMEIASSNISTLDLSQSPEGEVETFVEHRFDQSILSLILKSRMISENTYKQAGGFSGIKSQTRAFLFHPIWTSRNRSGKTIQNKSLRLLGNLSFFLNRLS